jgi:hypothetical protein
MANVYVFNCFNEPITGLSVAGYLAGDLPGYADGKTPNAPIYTPSSIPVARSKTPQSSASFAIGNNALIAPWDSFRASATITIPDPAKQNVSLDDPLLLFLAVNDAILLTIRGYVLGEFPVALTTQAGEAIAASAT